MSPHTRTLSPSISTAGSQANTLGQSPRLNIVTKLAIEGKSKQGEDGASIRMYLKIALPTDTVVPGSTIPLFPEENLKILTSQVHPIDSTFVPYNFSSTTCPLLHSAARALSLPARSSQSYLTLFGLPGLSSNFGSLSRTSSYNSVNPPPLDDKYTGHILVSGYSVSYVLPKEFPPRYKIGHDDNVRATPFRSRRASISDKSNIHFMVAIEMWIPYVSKPVKAPYLLSIPLPKCLSNSVKMRIFPPAGARSASTSFASLSSAEDEAGSWDLTADPHVTRNASSRLSRANSYNTQQFADDESSDSSIGFSESCIQGTFPSSERLRLRWAAPILANDGDDGRRRVGVAEVKGETTCIVLGKQREGVIIRVEYKGSCKGVWFPGVATLLGMDVALQAKGSDVAWAPGSEPKWEVSGGSGYTGFDNGSGPPRATMSRQSSMDSGAIPMRPGMNGRHESTASSTSLLRAPLPAQGIAEYSFEGSGSGVSGTSSMGSLPPTTSNSESQNFVKPPITLTTLHINMNDLLPPLSKGVFTFSISGTILVTPQSRGTQSDPDPIFLPRFHVLAAEHESTSTLIRNDVDNANVEVFNSTGDLRDAQTRKTVLQKAGFTRCGVDGGRIALRTLKRNAWGDQESDVSRIPSLQIPTRPRTPSNPIQRVASTSFLRATATSGRPKRDGALVIPEVQATVTPLVSSRATLPHGYAVRLRLPAPADADSSWLEFGLAQSSPAPKSPAPRVEITSATVEDVPVRFEVTAAARPEVGSSMVNLKDAAAEEWVSWVRVHVGQSGGGEVIVDYVVETDVKGKGKESELSLNVLLPTFALPVARLEVLLDTDLDVSSLRSNLLHEQATFTGHRLLRYTCPEMCHPHLSFAVRRAPLSSTVMDRTLRTAAWTMPTFLSLLLLLWLLNLGTEVREIRHLMHASSCSHDPPTPALPVEPVTFTTTIISTQWHKPLQASPKPVTLLSPPPLPIAANKALTTATTTAIPTPIVSSELTVTYKPYTPPPAATTGPYDILPAYTLPFPWMIQFDLPPIAQAAAKTLAASWARIWQAARVVFHYPLDPP